MGGGMRIFSFVPMSDSWRLGRYVSWCGINTLFSGSIQTLTTMGRKGSFSWTRNCKWSCFLTR